MKRIIIFVAGLVMVLMPLTLFAAVHPGVVESRATWVGGPVNSTASRVEGASLTEIEGKASVEAINNGQPVVYKTEDGRMMYQAYPDYGKSKCGFVHGKTWEEGKLTQSKIIEVCNRNYEEPSPYVPRVPTVNPSIFR